MPSAFSTDGASRPSGAARGRQPSNDNTATVSPARDCARASPPTAVEMPPQWRGGKSRVRCKTFIAFRSSWCSWCLGGESFRFSMQRGAYRHAGQNFRLGVEHIGEASRDRVAACESVREAETEPVIPRFDTRQATIEVAQFRIRQRPAEQREALARAPLDHAEDDQAVE